MDDFISMIFAKADIILKSKGVFYTPPGSEPTPVAYHPEHYGESLARHHPFDVDYGTIDPTTGHYATLTHHPAGMHGNHAEKGGIEGFDHPFGETKGKVLWPMEAVMKGIFDFIQEKGFTHASNGFPLQGETEFGPYDAYHFAEHVIELAIERFNQRHVDPQHRLPPLVITNEHGQQMIHPDWSQVTMGAYPKQEGERVPGEKGIIDSHMMPTRNENGDLITFYLSSGTTMGEPERGPFPESGAVPFYKELKEVLNEELGRGMSMNFVHQPYIEPHMMNPMMSREMSGQGQQGFRTLTPKQSELMAQESHYGQIAPELLIAHHPDIFFHVPTKGGRKSPAAQALLQEYNQVLGWGLDDGQIAHIAQAPISALLTPGKKIADEGKYLQLYDDLGQHTGLHPGRARRFGVWRRGKEGTPEELQAAYAAYKDDPEQWDLKVGEHSDTHRRHRSHSQPHYGEGYGQGTMSHSQNALALLGGAHEHGVDLNHAWNEHAADTGKPQIIPGSPEHANAHYIRNFYQQIAAHRIQNNPALTNLMRLDFEGRGHPQAAMDQPLIPQEWQSVPSPSIQSTHIPSLPVGQPQPDLPEIRTSPREYTEAENRLLKAMETIQLANARTDPQVLKLLPIKKHLNLNNHDDVLLMANRLEITPQDVHSITHTQGDWQNIAKTLQIPPSLVGSVKLVFGE